MVINRSELTPILFRTLFGSYHVVQSVSLFFRRRCAGQGPEWTGERKFLGPLHRSGSIKSEADGDLGRATRPFPPTLTPLTIPVSILALTEP